MSDNVRDEDAIACVAALLFSAEAPLNLSQLKAASELDTLALQQALEQLPDRLVPLGLALDRSAEGWRIRVADQYVPRVRQLHARKAPKLSRAQLETLAIIAHRQPVTRAEIEQIRGVSVASGVMQALQNYGWIRITGHKDVPGKPALWRITRQLLIDLGVESEQALQLKLDEIVRQTQLELQNEQQN
ncbi:SMC-Scp complex subunit ScpB [Sulfurivirga sp.]|uniref:SMC-Scp complex subunit ScpB n=1 Tax=Sulfurivirga sp. TaxID=2614236 RepID=UPI0025F2C922|nr:SMC-Scp complex subunit ScpB [Sulfurivirga sp.]